MTQAGFYPAIPGDERILARLRQRVWGETYRGIYPDEMIDRFDFPWHEAQDRAKIQSPHWRVYRISVDTETVGYLILKLTDTPTLQSLYLLKQAQRQGIGKQAFEMTKNMFREQGKTYFICYCQPNNKNAIAFYLRMGGRIIARDEGNEYPMENSVTFRFSL